MEVEREELFSLGEPCASSRAQSRLFSPCGRRWRTLERKERWPKRALGRQRAFGPPPSRETGRRALAESPLRRATTARLAPLQKHLRLFSLTPIRNRPRSFPPMPPNGQCPWRSARNLRERDVRAAGPFSERRVSRNHGLGHRRRLEHRCRPCRAVRRCTATGVPARPDAPGRQKTVVRQMDEAPPRPRARSSLFPRLSQKDGQGPQQVSWPGPFRPSSLLSHLEQQGLQTTARRSRNFTPTIDPERQPLLCPVTIPSATWKSTCPSMGCRYSINTALNSHPRE